MRKAIAKDVERKLYAESMGKCMNPDCQKDLFIINGDIAEKAHIIPHCDTANNSFENLIILCPNCHTSFDKNSAFDEEEVKSWKSKRQEQISQIFAQQFDTFDELEEAVKPILRENKAIFENYYVKDKPKLWKKFEETILINNQKLKLLLEQNRTLIQRHENESYSNLAIVDQLILHIDEFISTREDEDKIRSVLFPEEVNSIFGLEEIYDKLLPSSESLECLIQKLLDNDCFIDISLDTDTPYIKYKVDGEIKVLHLNDIPRLRQLYNDYCCFRKVELRLDSLTYILKWLKKNNIEYTFPNFPSLSDIEIKGKLFKFLYVYCLSRADLISLAPKRGLVIFNLHNFNGSNCISEEAYSQAEIMEAELLLHDTFFKYVYRI